MDTTDFRLFEKLYVLRNLTEVSKELYLSQPTVSYRLSKMQDEIGTKLYEYDGSYHFTEEGKEFYRFCRDAIAGYEGFKSRVKKTRYFTINLSSVAGYAYLPTLFTLFRSHDIYPLINISNSDTAITELLEHKSSAAIVGGVKGELPKELHMVELKREKIVLMYNKNLPDDIEAIDIIIDENRSGLHALVLDFCETHGVSRIVGEVGSSFEKIFLAQQFEVGFFMPERYLDLVKFDTAKVKVSDRYYFYRNIFFLYPVREENNPIIRDCIEKLNKDQESIEN